MKQRNDYQWGASQYLAHFEIGEVRIYNERFPWRSLHSIATRLKKSYGIQFVFNTIGDEKIITRVR